MRIIFLFAMTAMALFMVGCGATARTAKPYSSAKDGFTVTFPSDSKEVVVQKPQFALDDKDATYTTVNNDGAYKIKVIYWPSHDEVRPPQEDLIGSGANLDIPSDPDTKQITFQGKPAIDSTGWLWSENSGADGAPVKMQARTIGFRADADKVFVIQMKTLEKEKLTSKAANDFFNSFKLGAQAPAK